jgi:hypothetical protein
MSEHFPNYAGRSNVDRELSEELEMAGITVVKLPESIRHRDSSEVHTIIIGELLLVPNVLCTAWVFNRAWIYWVCKGPGIPMNKAMQLHEQYGDVVRADGHCGCPSPREWYGGLGSGHYHVDTFRGLKALADTIKSCIV